MAYNDTATDPSEPNDLFAKLSAWVKEDIRGTSEWRREARHDFAFHAGDQWAEADKERMRETKRPAVTFNRVAPTCQAVMGMEVSNRQEVKFLPRTTSSATMPGPVDPMTGQPSQQPVPGGDDQGVAETFTAGVHYFRDECDAEDEDTDAFQDDVICGMGWTETRIDYDEDPDGMLVVDRIDPLEMVWDCKATKRNLIDARRKARIREVDIEVARQMFPGYDNDQLHAGWADISFTSEGDHDRELARTYSNEQGEQGQNRKTVRIVEIEWCDKVNTHQVFDDATGQIIELDDKQFAVAKERLEALGRPVAAKKVTKKIYRQAFLGGDVLDVTESQCQYGFKFQAMTGYRDRNKRQWVGIVRSMRDPQRWANALFSSVLNSIMTSGKGVMAERGAFDDDNQAETTLADATRITWLNAGGLSGQNPKVVPKPQGTLPAGINDMLTFALQSMRDVTGVNVEVLGLADREQAASLEYQRRQAATTILAPFFDGLRRYRKDQGRLLMHLVNEYLADGRLVRVVGPDQEKYVPFIRDPQVTKYDIIVDEAPSSPNQKEATWVVIQGLMPLLQNMQLPMDVWGKILKASPLPESTVQEINASLKEAAQNQGPSPEQQKLQLEAQKIQMDTQAKQQELQMEGAKAQMDAQVKAEEVQVKHAELGVKMQEIEVKKAELELKRLELGLQEKELLINAATTHATQQFEREKLGHEAATQQMDMMADREKAESQIRESSSQIQQIAQGIGKALADAVTENNKAIAEPIMVAAEGMQDAAKAMTAPKRIIYNAQGMPEGFESMVN